MFSRLKIVFLTKVQWKLRNHWNQDMSRDLIYAASQNFPGTVRDLLPYASSQAKSYALWLASLNGLERIQEILLEDKVPAQAQLDGLLCRAAKRGDVNDMISALNNGADIHNNNDFALRLAAENGHIDATRRLLDRGADARRAFSVSDLFGGNDSRAGNAALALIERTFLERPQRPKPDIGFQFAPNS